MNIHNVAVIGAGTMGSGIAQVFAQKSHPVALLDVKQEFVDRAMINIRKSLDKLVKKEKIAADEAEEILGRIRPTLDFADIAQADLVVEAVIEKFEVKAEVLKKADKILPPKSILSSNTSSISITKLAGVTSRPDRFAGMHFMNPVPVMTLVELVWGLRTSKETMDTIESAAKELGKVPIRVNDSPGFVSNRVLLPMINEAAFALREGVATPEAIDEIMKLGMNHPMGPLALADLIGLDVCLSILNVLFEGFGDTKYRPCPIFKTMVDAGFLGRKTGRGFYEYKEALDKPRP
jgi:3-hydroxybutyryl-CoA dehydrogenase